MLKLEAYISFSLPDLKYETNKSIYTFITTALLVIQDSRLEIEPNHFA